MDFYFICVPWHLSAGSAVNPSCFPITATVWTNLHQVCQGAITLYFRRVIGFLVICQFLVGQFTRIEVFIHNRV